MSGTVAARGNAWCRLALALTTAAFAVALAPSQAFALLRPVSIDNVARSLAPLPLPRAKRVIVGASDAAHMAALGDTLAGLGATVERRFSWNAYLVSPPGSLGATAFAEAVLVHAGVRYARPDGVVRATTVVAGPNDEYFGDQWGLSRVGAPAAWVAGTGSGVRIAVIDTGIDLANPDLGPQVVGGTSYVSATYADDNGHGTHVAGIVAAIANDSYGIAGVAPGARLLVVKALDFTGAGSESSVADGVRWAVANGAKVISMSLATTQARGVGADPLGDAVAFAESQGCLVVAAAGNTGAADRVWPAAYPGVVGVAATDRLDRRASFSTTGTRPDGDSVAVLAAPGVDILSYYLPTGSLAWSDGTSMATPFVSGAAAAVWSAHSSWDATRVAQQLTASALDLPPAGRDNGTGWGRLRLDVALGQPMSPDAYEPDDSTAVAPVMAVESTVQAAWHDFAPAGETDVAALDLTAGRDYQVWTSDLSGGADTALGLYAPVGVTLLASNDDASLGSASSYLRFTAPSSGRFFVAVGDPRSRGGGYVLNTLALRTSTALSIRANTSRPRYRRYFTLSGALWPSMPGSTVTLQVIRPGSRSWVGVAALPTYGTAAGNGTLWSRRYRPTRSGTYKFRVVYAGDAGWYATTSGILTRRVR